MKLYSYYTTEAPENVVACGLYAHGQLQDQLGYDVVCPLYNPKAEGRTELVDLKEDGVYPVEVVHHNEVIPATLFYWLTQGWHRGLVVLPTDQEAYQYAQERFNRRVRHL